MINSNLGRFLRYSEPVKERYHAPAVGTVTTWQSEGDPTLYHVHIEKIQDGLIHSRSVYGERNIIKVRPEWAFLTSFAASATDKGITITHELLEGDLPEILNLRDGEVYHGRILEKRPDLTFTWDYEICVIGTFETETYFGTQEVIAIEERRSAHDYRARMVLHYAPAARSFTYYEYGDNRDFREISRVIGISGNPVPASP